MPPAPRPFERPSGTAAAASPSHDLKNLLAVILGVCEQLSETLDPATESGELARVGLLAAERAGRVVHQMQDEAPRPAAPELVPQPEGQGRTVLVVEDDPDLLRLITAAFARAGFKAYSARNGRLALQLLRALEPDLMVTDIVMPEKEGIATIIEAKQAAPNTSVIAISGGGQYGRTGNFLQWAEELGADEVMAKPFPMSQLLTAARVVLDRKASPVASSAAF
jgi:CheY-like chemotaxis protein